MRNLLWILLLANTGLFFWSRWDVPPPPRPDPAIAPATLVPLTAATGLVPRRATSNAEPPAALAAAPGTASVSAAPSDTTTALPPVAPGAPATSVGGSESGQGPSSEGGPSSPTVTTGRSTASMPTAVSKHSRPACAIADIAVADAKAARTELRALGVPYRVTPGSGVYEVVSPVVATAAYAALARQARRLQLPHAPTPGGTRLSYGVFRRRANAERELRRLARRHVSAEIKPSRPVGPWILGPVSQALQRRLALRLHTVLKQHSCSP